MAANEPIKMQHSPSPWHKTPFGVKGFLILRDHISLAHVNANDPYYVEANANLIAAAPDMFEVLKEMYDWSILNECRGPIFPKLEAAYLKAIGEQKQEATT